MQHATGATAAQAAVNEGFLRIEAVGKRFGATRAVDAVTLAIRRGEIFALLGSSGCGKSTLLRMVAGFEMPSEGRIVLDGDDLARVPAHRRPIGMMFQSYALFPHMTVASNVAFGLRQVRPRLPRARVVERVAAMLELVQLEQLGARRPHELSGGQQQRAALARCLAREPKLLLLDEPLSALDKKIRQRTQLELVALVRRVGVTCIIVTHDQEEAMAMADRIGVMSPQGRLLQVGTPGEIYEAPASRYTAEFVGETNLFAGRIEGGRLRCADVAQALALELPATLREGDEAWLSVRPERLRMVRGRPPAAAAPTEATPTNRIAGTVSGIAYLGSHSIVQVQAASGRLLVASVPQLRRDDAARPAHGEQVWLEWDAGDGVVLPR